MLLGAETIDRNLTAAVAHLSMLRHYFQSDKGINLGLLLYVVYHDIHIAAMFLCPPAFDVDRWLPAKFEPMTRAAEPHLPQDLFNVNMRFLDPSIDNIKLRTLFIERREILEICLANRKSDESEHASSILG